MEFTKEMQNCIRLYFTLDSDGWELGCKQCPIAKEKKVKKDSNGVCIIFNQCHEWITKVYNGQ